MRESIPSYPFSGRENGAGRRRDAPHWHPAYFQAIDELKAAAERAGQPLIDLALNWVLHHTPTDCVLMGASTVEQLAQNVDAIGKGPLPEDVVKTCDEVWNRLRGITPRYNR